mmetsp:Transcript_18297/g.56769  ORF Transcript_18297/g.56769 Transcript_18297/m.56769 type:complete len:244 (+) Transcript_18297:770-1501(+)
MQHGGQRCLVRQGRTSSVSVDSRGDRLGLVDRGTHLRRRGLRPRVRWEGVRRAAGEVPRRGTVGRQSGTRVGRVQRAAALRHEPPQLPLQRRLHRGRRLVAQARLRHRLERLLGLRLVQLQRPRVGVEHVVHQHCRARALHHHLPDAPHPQIRRLGLGQLLYHSIRGDDQAAELLREPFETRGEVHARADRCARVAPVVTEDPESHHIVVDSHAHFDRDRLRVVSQPLHVECLHVGLHVNGAL